MFDLKDVVTRCLRFTSQKYYNTFSPPQIPVKEYDNIMDENNQG